MDANASSGPGLSIVVADDDPSLRTSLERALRVAGHTIHLAVDGGDALEQVSAVAPDLVVLDVTMPVLTGLDVCRVLRREGNDVPILMLTARDAIEDRVAGLDAGADDYLVKPFALDELLARIRALGRRSVPGLATGQLRVADLVIDTDAHEVLRGERLLDLTRTEFQLLAVLGANAGKVCTREILYDRVWGYDASLASNSLEVYVGYLRRKTEAGGEPRLIQTVRGVGYVLKAPT